MSARLLRANAPMRQLEAAASSSLFRLTARSFLPPSSASSSFVSVYARSFSSSPASIRTLSTLSSTLFPSRQLPSVSLARPPAPSRRSQSSSTSSSSRPSAVEDDSPDKLPLGQRLKALMKKYGWWAVGVYGVLSLFDFGVAFALVQYLGVERIKQAEKSIKVWAKESTGWTWGEQDVVAASKEQLEEGRKEIKKKGYDSSFWAQVAIVRTPSSLHAL